MALRKGFYDLNEVDCTKLSIGVSYSWFSSEQKIRPDSYHTANSEFPSYNSCLCKHQ